MDAADTGVDVSESHVDDVDDVDALRFFAAADVVN